MYTISEMQSILNINASTLRYYEKEGILPEIERNDGGRRVYKEEHVLLLKFLLCLKETGMSIEDLKAYMNLGYQVETMLEDRRDILIQHKKSVEHQIAQIQSNLERINQKIGFYDDLISKKNLPE
ncbi:MerR family transcriptional regulator [Paenibacillus illinoisensis]|uniref:MerR family transcriptional regulator n=1 Tax=Paenibacillus illinoisensis TaxID=59845 RepID=UPI000FD6DC5A|nr:MerR family transcriptional regulator [Paenibacillus illinoisensis]